MTIVLVCLGCYLLAGFGALCILEGATKRISSRIKTASLDTYQVIGESPKLALVLTLIALWVFWPAAIYAAFVPEKVKKEEN